MKKWRKSQNEQSRYLGYFLCFAGKGLRGSDPRWLAGWDRSRWRCVGLPVRLLNGSRDPDDANISRLPAALLPSPVPHDPAADWLPRCDSPLECRRRGRRRSVLTTQLDSPAALSGTSPNSCLTRRHSEWMRLRKYYALSETSLVFTLMMPRATNWQQQLPPRLRSRAPRWCRPPPRATLPGPRPPPTTTWSVGRTTRTRCTPGCTPTSTTLRTTGGRPTTTAPSPTTRQSGRPALETCWWVAQPEPEVGTTITTTTASCQSRTLPCWSTTTTHSRRWRTMGCRFVLIMPITPLPPRLWLPLPRPAFPPLFTQTLLLHMLPLPLQGLPLLCRRFSFHKLW